MKLSFKFSKSALYHTFSFIPYLLCLLILTLTLGIRIHQEQRVYKSTFNQIENSVRSLDQSLSKTLDILTKLSVSKENLDFLDQDSFSPSITLDAYNLFSKSYNVITNYDTYIGTYNSHIDLLLSNLGTSNLDFFLNYYHFTNTQEIYDFIHNVSTDKSYSSLIIESTSQNYVLYLTKNSNLLKHPVSFVLFNKNCLIDSFIPYNAPFDFEIYLESVSNYEKEDLLYTSTALPLVYKATPHIKRFERPIYKITNLILLISIIITLLLTIRFFYKKVQRIKANRMNKILESQALLLKEVIYGVKNNNIKEMLHKHNLHILDDSFLMILVTLKPNCSNHSPISKIYLDELLSPIYPASTFKVLMVSETTYVIFINTIHRENLYSSLKPLRTNLASYFLIITKVLELNEVSSKFYYLNQLTKNNTILNQSNLLLEENINIKLPVSYTFTEQDQKLLLYHLKSQNQVEFLNLVDMILTENILKRKLSHEFYNQFLTLMCNQLNRLSSSYKDTDLILQELLQTTDKNEVKTILYDLFEEYYTLLVQEEPKNDMEHKFFEYIHTHYQHDISLTDMANEFNLAINYVGVLFKEKTGHNFKDYLNAYRIECAKQLLNTSSSIKIKDLSCEVGFVNINTFIRLFKKYVGMSPGQYQKYILEKDTAK